MPRGARRSKLHAASWRVPSRAAVGQAVGEGEIGEETGFVADPARDTGGTWRHAGKWRRDEDGPRRRGRGRGFVLVRASRAVAGFGFLQVGGRQGEEAVDERVVFQQWTHDLTCQKDDFFACPLAADGFQAGGGEDHVTDAVGAAEQERRQMDGRWRAAVESSPAVRGHSPGRAVPVRSELRRRHHEFLKFDVMLVAKPIHGFDVSGKPAFSRRTKKDFRFVD